MENSNIQWCDHTFNPWRGCCKVATGCKHCYALRDAKRFPKNRGVFGTEAQGGTRVVAAEGMWREPAKWNKKADEDNDQFIGGFLPDDMILHRPRVFTASLSDIFEEWRGPVMDHNGVQLYQCCCGSTRNLEGACGKCGRLPHCGVTTINDVRKRLFQTIDETPNLDWLVLTKRPENIRKMWPLMRDNRPVFPGAPGKLGESIPCLVKGARRENVWLGCSVANQEDAEKNIPELLKCHDLAGKIFLSVEPLVGPVDLTPWIGYNPVHETKTQRRSGVRGDQDGPSGDQERRVDMEDQVSPSEPMEQRGSDNDCENTEASGCVGGGGLSASQDNDRREADRLPGSSASLASLQKSDSSGHADQSQERNQKRQSTGKSGSRDEFRERQARPQNRSVKSVGDEQQQNKTDDNGCGGDTNSLRDRKTKSEGVGGAVRGCSSNHIKIGSRGQDAERTGNYSRLHGESNQGNAATEQQGTISLVIIGGESGPDARPCNIEWIRDIVRQCKEAGVPCFVKQLGSGWARAATFGADWINHPKGGDIDEWPEDIRVREFPE